MRMIRSLTSTSLLFLLFAGLSGWGLTGTSHAQGMRSDKITLQLSSGSQITVRCEILDYTGEKITFRTKATGEPTVKPASEVLAVETPQTEGHVTGLKLFAKGDYQASRESFQGGYVAENRDWVKREILGMLLRADLKMADYEMACTHFQILAQSDPTTRYIKYIPLNWTPMQLNNKWKEDARKWLSATYGPLRLLGASYLLNDPAELSLAKLHLRRLQANTDPRISALATAQYWRTQISPDILDAILLKRWETLAEKMPREIRGGPYYMLGQAYAFRREYQQAAASLLWVPLAYDHDAGFSARAMLEAADLLKMYQSEPEAMQLYAELVKRYPDTESARIAADALNQSRLDSDK